MLHLFVKKTPVSYILELFGKVSTSILIMKLADELDNVQVKLIMQ